jgi:ParB-like chromosome segregation protein Spo0J
MERKLLGIDVIRIDGGTQCRAEINQTKVSEYADLIESGVVFPAVRVFFDGVSYWLADGFHRYHAHKQAGQGSISADIEKGTARAALLYAISANAEHGLPRTNADKRKAVQMMLDDFEWQDWSNAEIARHCKVSVTYVANMRGDTAPEERKYKTATGKVMTKKAPPKPKKEEEAEPDDV